MNASSGFIKLPALPNGSLLPAHWAVPVGEVLARADTHKSASAALTQLCSVCATSPRSLAVTTIPTVWACLTACFVNSSVCACFGILFVSSRSSSLHATHRLLENEKRGGSSGPSAGLVRVLFFRRRVVDKFMQKIELLSHFVVDVSGLAVSNE